MALKGLDIFKLTPKTNCKECGSPTCMAFAMKVAQGAVLIEKCPHMSDDALAQLSDATAPPMQTIKAGTGDFEVTMGGETVLARHEKKFVSKNLFAVEVSVGNEEALKDVANIDYERIGERMIVELINVKYTEGTSSDDYVELVKKANEASRVVIIDCKDEAIAAAALAVCKDNKPILNSATSSNYEAMSKLATDNGVVLGVEADSVEELYSLVEKLIASGNKNLVLNASIKSIKEAFKYAVEIRRTAVKGEDRTFGYPTIINATSLAKGDKTMQTALASLFTMKYGSIIVMEGMEYAQALPLYGLRQNVYTDPQKPMKVDPGIYPLNGADENAPCVTTVDFALTYFVVSGELERSGVPCNLLISDAGGYSVLTAWAAGKLSASSIGKFFDELEVENKIKNRTLIIPGKVAVLKGEIQERLPGWDIVVAPNEAVQLVKFMQSYK